MNQLLKIFILLLLFTPSLFSQIEFESHVLINGDDDTRYPRQVEKIDIDDDGDLDLLVACSINAHISWYEMLEDGTFGPQRTIHKVPIPNGGFLLYDLVLIDFDYDDDLDIVYSYNKAVYWKKNKGDGIFETYQIEVEDDLINDLKATDLNSDGYIDIVIKVKGESMSRWYKYKDSEFEESTFINESGIYQTLIIEDFDNDGDKDILTYEDEDVVWYANKMNTLEFEKRTIEKPDDLKLDHYFNKVDIDNNGLEDYYFIGLRDSEKIFTRIEATKDSLAFGQPEELFVLPDEDSFGTIYFDDLDQDDDQDLIVHKSDGSVVWFENIDSKGTFANEKMIHKYVIQMRDLLTMDMGNDGDLDVIMAVRINNHFISCENIDGQGTFNTPENISEYIRYPQNVNLLDLDDDGDTDIFCSSADGKFMWFENLDGYIQFSTQKIAATFIGDHYVDIGDIDNDGDWDIVAHLDWYDELVWYENLGGGIFSAKKPIQSNFKLSSEFTLLDLGNDGNHDIVFRKNGNLLWYEINDDKSEITLIQEVEFESLFSFKHLESPDITTRLICTDSNTKNIYLLEYNNNLKQFNEKELVLNEVSEYNIIAYPADISNSEDFDIVYLTTENGDYDIYTRLRNEDGTFQDAVNIYKSSYIANIEFCDIDNDGDNDILINNFWFENLDGAGNFGTSQIVGSFLEQGSEIKCGDLDNDGDNDVVKTSSKILHSSVVYYENKADNGNDIRGVVALDLENDNCADPSQYANGLMVTTQRNATSMTSTAVKNGYYQLFPSLGEYETKITSPLPPYFDVVPEKYNETFESFGNTIAADFCLIPNQNVNDVEISIYSIDAPRIGEPHIYQLKFKNSGTSISSGEITIHFGNDGKLNFESSTYTPSEISDEYVIFSFENLMPFESRLFEIETTIAIPPTAMLGDIMSVNATIVGNPNDNTIENNYDELSEVVVGSFDPNDIRVREGSFIDKSEVGNYLHYVIRFQNTGTSFARNVAVENPIDNNLEWRSFDLLSTSHDVKVEIKDGKDLLFVFNDINLIDSTTNEKESHGYIAYRIKTKADLGVGEMVKNRASIYFDFNSPIITNQVTTTVTEELSIPNLSDDKTIIYPNPTSDVCYVDSKKPIKKIEIYDVNSELKLVTKKNSINIKQLPNGIYFAKIVFSDNSFISRQILKI